MMRKIYLLVFISVFCFIVNGQTFQWAKRMGSTGFDAGLSLVYDVSGNVYTTGTFSGTVDFDPGAGVFNLVSAGDLEVFISKLDASGNFVWAKSIEGPDPSGDIGQAITVDASGNVYTTGYFRGTADFDPGAGVFNLTSAGFGDVFILKLDASGNFVWAKRFGGTSSDTGYGIKIDASGNVYTAGPFNSTVDFDPNAGVYNMTSAGFEDVFVSKLDASGNFVWARQLGGTGSERAWSMTLDGSGNVYTTGNFSGTGDFDPGAGTFNLTSSGSDIFISKLDASGNFVWAKQMGGTGSDYGYSISLDGSGNVYTTGNFNSVADFDPGAGVFNLTSAGSDDVFISKLDASGNFVWAKRMGAANNDTGYDLIVDGSGNLYTTGYFMSTVDFDPGAGVFNLTSGGVEDIFISKLDASGNFVWALKMGATGSDLGRSIDLDGSGNIYTAGYFNGTADFDPGAGVFNLTSAGGNDIFIQKLANCAGAPATPGSISGLTSLCIGAGIQTYSIATVVGATSYTWSLPGGWSGSSATNTIGATPGSTGVFTVTASNLCGTSPQQTLSVTVNALPTIAVNSGSICSGQSFTMVPNGASTYTFQGGSAVVSPTTNTSYTVIGTSSAGCTSSVSATSNVTVNSLPNIAASSSTNQLCIGSSATLSASGGSSYTWNPGGPGTSIVISPTVNTTYTLNGTDANGCSNSTVLTQAVINCPTSVLELKTGKSELEIYPNPFSNKLTIITNGTRQDVQVFNTLGSLIYKTKIENEKTEIDLSNHSSGIYFIRFGSVTKKIIKE